MTSIPATPVSLPVYSASIQGSQSSSQPASASQLATSQSSSHYSPTQFYKAWGDFQQQVHDKVNPYFQTAVAPLTKAKTYILPAVVNSIVHSPTEHPITVQQAFDRVDALVLDSDPYAINATNVAWGDTLNIQQIRTAVASQQAVLNQLVSIVEQDHPELNLRQQQVNVLI